MNVPETLTRLGDVVGPWLGERPWAQALTIVVAAAVTAALVDRLFTHGITIWTRRTSSPFDDRLLALVHRPLFTSILLVGVWLASERLTLSASVAALLLRLLKTLALLLWTVFALRASRLVLSAASSAPGGARYLEPRMVALAENTVKVLLIGAAAYLLFLSWGIDVGGWLVSAGVLGLVLGLAAKDTLANLFAGIFILADAPYKVGDFVNLDSGERGRVTQVGLRSTRLLTRDDVEITVPNAVIANAKIVNESGGPWEKERVRVKVGVAYGSDLDRVRSVLMSVARSHPLVLDDPEPRVRLRALGDSALELELLGWIEEPVLRGRVLDALLESVYRRFGDEGIGIPFPQRDVHLRRESDEQE